MSEPQQLVTTPSSRLRVAVSLVFGFFLSLALALGLLAVVVLETLASAEQLCTLFDENYCADVHICFDEQVRSYTQESGINDAVLEGVFTPEDTYRDVQNYAEATLAGGAWRPEDNPAFDELRSRVIAALRAEDVLRPKAIPGVADAYVDDIKAFYRWNIEAPVIDALAGVHAMCRQALPMALCGFCTLVAVLAGALLRLCRTPDDRLTALASSVAGAGLMNLILPLWIRTTGWQATLHIEEPQVVSIFERLGNQLLEDCLVGAVGCLVLSIVLLVALVVVARRSC